MAKRGKTVKKTVTVTEITTKAKPSKSTSAPQGEDKTNKLLLENFIALQEALTNIGYETKDLNKKLSSLIDLFETAARNFQEHPESRNINSKIDEIIEQNKIIAKSLLLMHKTTKEKLDETSKPAPSKPVAKDTKDFKPSITDEEESAESSEDNSDEVKVEKDDGSESESSEDFKPEPLPEFNF